MECVWICQIEGYKVVEIPLENESSNLSEPRRYTKPIFASL